MGQQLFNKRLIVWMVMAEIVNVLGVIKIFLKGLLMLSPTAL